MHEAALIDSPPCTSVERYYRWHARIYDATRWSFLFGRERLLKTVAGLSPKRVLEVGCGTGRNLAGLARLLPGAEITGVDLSPDMLRIARQKMANFGGRAALHQLAYDAPLTRGGGTGFDVVLFSYALSMFNPGWERALNCGLDDLAPGGHLAVVDFHDSRSAAFKRWMGINHVRMDGQIRPALIEALEPVIDRQFKAYGGLWHYCLFLGRRRP